MTQLGKVIAPFWSDNDIRKEGTVRYITYCNITNQAQCAFHNESQIILDEVNRFIQSNQADSSQEPFVGTWMLIAQWDQVHPSPHGAEDTEGIPPEELSKVLKLECMLKLRIILQYLFFADKHIPGSCCKQFISHISSVYIHLWWCSMECCGIK